MALEPHARLKAAREHAGYRTAASAARAFGWQVHTYKTHESGLRGMKPEIAAAYGRAFRVDAAWLLFGKNPPAWASQNAPALQGVRIATYPEIDWRDVARYVAAYPDIAGIAVMGEREIDSAANLQGAVFFLRVRDRAMTTSAGGISFAPGDLIGCNANATPEPGDFVVALPDEAETPVLRRLQSRGPGVYDLQPLNPDYPTLHIGGGGPGRILARVVAHTKHF